MLYVGLPLKTTLKLQPVRNAGSYGGKSMSYFWKKEEMCYMGKVLDAIQGVGCYLHTHVLQHLPA